jgi:hypothetical protein
LFLVDVMETRIEISKEDSVPMYKSLRRVKNAVPEVLLLLERLGWPLASVQIDADKLDICPVDGEMLPAMRKPTGRGFRQRSDAVARHNQDAARIRKTLIAE